ncbi:MAG: hypothetical protein JNM17_04110 [Archangium sp.]|nr:hypothetical protein [Archangium sp.]
MSANLVPSPFSRLATSVVSGLVSIAAQTFAGIKTFAALIIASAGIQVATVFNNNGTNSGDRGVIVGFSTADGSVNSGAKPLSAGTGVGGTYVEKFYVNKAGTVFIGANANCGLSDVGNAIGATVVITTQAYMASTNASTAFYAAAAGGFSANTTVRIWGESQGDAAGETAVRSGAFLTGHDDAYMHEFAHSQGSTPVAVARVMGSGRFDQRGTDSTGSPGAATINKPIGKSSIAAGASSVVITNSLVAAGSVVVITPHARDATCKELIAVAAGGSFTVSGSANATANLPFSWEVKGII